jgi:lipopolysaccharide export system permease protein
MLTIVDRYLLRQFVQTLVICFLSLVGLYVVIDAFGHLDHFVDYADKQGNLLGILAGYYGFRSIAFFDRLSGVLTLVAVMFTVTWIQRHHEMTALLAAGIPRMRVLRAVLAAAVGVSLIAAANREFLIPSIRHRLAVDSKSLGGDAQSVMQARFDNQTRILIGGKSIVPTAQKIIDPNFVLPQSIGQFSMQHLTAREARYLPSDGARPAGYLLTGDLSPKAITSQPSLIVDGVVAVITPPDADWLAPDEVFVASNVAFEFLSAGTTWRDFASTAELIRQVRSPSTNLGDDVRVAIHGRFLQPFLDTTLILLGLPLVVSRTNRNPFIAIGLCLALVTVFMAVVLACQSLGSTGWLRPTLAVWLPLILFVPLAVGLSDTLRK